jgi:hypothetical protein
VVETTPDYQEQLDPLTSKPDSKRLKKAMRKKFLGLILHQLPNPSLGGPLLIPAPKNSPNGHPPYIVMQFDGVVTPSTQSKLMAIWDALKASDYEWPVHSKTDHHSKLSPALHLGVWQLPHWNGPLPYVTANSW